jgi:hypothetical protein
LDHLGGLQLAAMEVNPLAEEVAQRAELTRAELVVEVRKRLANELPELAGDHVAKRVRREVAERPGGPVDVLEHAVGVVGDLDPKHLLRLRPPSLGKIGRREALLDELQLQLEAQRDVEVVGDLIRLDPDE